jgi:hypothetical protein
VAISQQAAKRVVQVDDGAGDVLGVLAVHHLQTWRTLLAPYTGDELSMRLPMNICRQSAFCVKLIRVSPATVLGVIALQGKCGHEAPSGFELSSPSDERYCLVAMYPSISGFEVAENLDHKIPT